jgi:hypothetical protein
MARKYGVSEENGTDLWQAFGQTRRQGDQSMAPWAAFPDIPITGTLFVEAFGQLTRYSDVSDSEDLYSVFHARAQLMGWDSLQGQSSSPRYASGPRRPLLWSMHEGELTAEAGTPRIGFVQVGVEAGVDPCLVLPPLLQCFDDCLRRFGSVELTALQVTGVDFEQTEGSAVSRLMSAGNWFNMARADAADALIAIDSGALQGRTEAELAASLRVMSIGSVVPLLREQVIEAPAGSEGTFGRSFQQSGLALAITLPEWTASAAGQALGLLLEKLRYGRPEVRDFRLRLARAS